MKFRTEYKVEKSSLILNPAKPVVLAGSCFSQNIALKMKAHLWEALNPAGTLYNPLSISKAIDIMIDAKNGREYFEKSLFVADGLWSSWWFDSSFSSERKEDCIEEFLIRQKRFNNSLREGGVLIVTFGTSICYYLSELHQPVGNCHKQPSSLFYKKRISVDEMACCWKLLLDKLQNKFPGIKAIFTVSPVRHLKDGFEGNSRSKAVLQLGVEEIIENNRDCVYFPAYEILNDDLRDYRFYGSDLTHPSEEAIDYIWDKFIETFLEDESRRLLSAGAAKFKASCHRPKTGALGKPLRATPPRS